MSAETTEVGEPVIGSQPEAMDSFLGYLQYALPYTVLPRRQVGTRHPRSHPTTR